VEWGNHAINTQFRRLTCLPLESDLRAKYIEACVRLYNFRTRYLHINQIQTVFNEALKVRMANDPNFDRIPFTLNISHFRLLRPWSTFLTSVFAPGCGELDQNQNKKTRTVMRLPNKRSVQQQDLLLSNKMTKHFSQHFINLDAGAAATSAHH